MKGNLKSFENSQSLNKKTLRIHSLQKRAALAPQRRSEGAKGLFEFYSQLYSFPNVLSFASFKSEIDSGAINQRLADEGRLILPKIEGGELALFRVQSLEDDLDFNPLGFREPKDRCERVALNLLHFALIPGLAFDADHFRLGYGQGYYDRLLSKKTDLITCGVGFKEQWIEKVPHESHDIALHRILLL